MIRIEISEAKGVEGFKIARSRVAEKPVHPNYLETSVSPHQNFSINNLSFDRHHLSQLVVVQAYYLHAR